ncbi:MAG TPA: hypothetical protein VNM87_07325, partial [Candidatus Udaeobacter sp.]|nr:hypothetical protein [Candidatus Udaeobacter sp.]
MNCPSSRILATYGALMVFSTLSLRPAQAADRAWEQAISHQLSAMEYEAGMGPAGLEAPNRAQNLRTHFQTSEIAIVARDAAESGQGWSFGWRLTGWGRPGDMHGVGA